MEEGQVRLRRAPMKGSPPAPLKSEYPGAEINKPQYWKATRNRTFYLKLINNIFFKLYVKMKSKMVN
jgi:hypothetical protein